METKTISIRIDKSNHEKMKEIDYINWSAVIRNALNKELSRINHQNKEKMKKAINTIDKIRKSKSFDKGKSSTKLIREWRNKRK
jgi:Arc/MetJ-type ribon-helix-helix transcriptional regulator